VVGAGGSGERQQREHDREDRDGSTRAHHGNVDKAAERAAFIRAVPVPTSAARRLVLTADRYLDAARNMKLRQLAARPRRLVPAAVLAAGGPKANGWHGHAAGLGIETAPQSGPQPGPEEDGRFRAVGRSRAYPDSDFWTDPRDGLLFLFHLHGFAPLARYAAGSRSADGFWEAVIGDWLTAFEKPARPAWHPYPTSTRLLAWCSALSAGGWEAGLARRMQASMRRQATMLRRSVEHDIGGNHVLHNGFALLTAGVCLGDAAGESAGLRLLAAELPRQLLADGGHEERSPAYHRELLDRAADAVALLERAGRPVPPWLTLAAERMRGWLEAVAGPAGDVPLLNDAWEGPRIEVPDRGPMSDLEQTGYVVLRHGRDQALLDVGPMAPAHLPPHGHADALSFLLWIDGEPVVVDRGSFSYAAPDRDRFRGTAAHNTVTVAGRDQCDLWGPFRAAHMPRVRRLVTEADDGVVRLVAEHDGYRRIGVVHRRTFLWIPGSGLVVLDRLIGAARDAVSRLHLAPGIAPEPGRIGPLRVEVLGGGALAIVEDRHSPYLGSAVPASVLESAARGAASGWALLRPGHRAELSGDEVVIRRAHGAVLSRPIG
jgi:uncharacterized heparinase superfamily protein